MSEKTLFLGRRVDPASGALTGDDVRLDPADLTTHAVTIGMTGSGKTGLCVDLLEELALQGIPALAVDPKGDLGNLLLTFPDLAPADFEPWLPPGEAERQGVTTSQYAERVAEKWRKGLAEWGLDGGRIRELRERADLTIYTPGSRAGTPVDVLSSFAPPDLSWDSDEEALLESIRFAVSALLSLLDVDADPLQSREHIFLSHLVETAWRSGAPCDVAALIGGLQRPPFEKLGVFEVESFYPARERMKLAVALNGLLAAPGFAPWIEGERLDPATLLRTADGRPRLAIFYLGHLAEREKLFFTTLLLAAVNIWMRRQGGTGSLRALVYVDEVVGMIPPYPANPPTKEILLLLMKQARAFGVGMALTTQNPVDVDYKVLTNAGTWFVGRLQTQPDKDRVLEGLVGQAGTAGATRAELDARIGALPQRTFLLYSARGGEPVAFRSRWALSYLRGPLTKEEIGRFKKTPDARAKAAPAERESAEAGISASAQGARDAPAAPIGRGRSSPGSGAPTATPLATSAPVVPDLPSLYVTPESLRGLGGLDPAPDLVADVVRYVPALYGVAAIRYDESKAGLNVTERVERLLFPIPQTGPRWSAARPVEIGPQGVTAEPHKAGAYEALPSTVSVKNVGDRLRKDLANVLVETSARRLWFAPDAKLYSRHDEDRAAFEARLARERAGARDAEVSKLQTKYAAKISALKRKLDKEEADAAAAGAAYEGRKREELVSGAESVVGFFFGRKASRAVSQASVKRRMTETARRKADREQQEAAGIRTELDSLSAQLQAEVAAIDARHGGEGSTIQELDVLLEKDDVRVETLAILWIPLAGP
jgi:hypothetical protein